MRNEPASFAAIKAKLKGKVNLNDLERAVKHQNRTTGEKTSDFAQALDLEGLQINNLSLPMNWQVSLEHGVTVIGIIKMSTFGGEN